MTPVEILAGVELAVKLARAAFPRESAELEAKMLELLARVRPSAAQAWELVEEGALLLRRASVEERRRIAAEVAGEARRIRAEG